MTSPRTWHYLALAALSVWILGFVLTPLLRSALPAATDLLYGVFSRACHQIPGRSFALAGSPLGVCARCTTFYISGWLILLVYLFKSEIRLFPGFLYWSLAVPMLADFFFEKIGIYHDQIVIRLITGALFGIALFHIFIVSLHAKFEYGASEKGYRWKTREL